jgi:hypothetical protein
LRSDSIEVPVGCLTDVQHSTSTDSTELSSHLHAALGAEYVVSGAYTVLNSEAKQHVRIDLRIQKAEDGSLVASTSQEGDADDLFLLVSRTGVELRRDLGAGPLPRNEEGQARAAMPANLPAERAYIAGLEKLRNFAAPEARDLLEQSVAADPSFPLAHMALSDAWHALGYQSSAKAEAKRAWELSSGLSREDQLRIEARYLRTIPDWNKAVEDFRALATFYPDNLDYAVDLAGAQSAAGKGNEALVTLSRLRHAGGEKNPRLDLAEAMAHGALSNYRAAAEAAGRAANEAHQNGQRWMMAKALLYQAGALGSAGDKAHADVVAEQARQLCEELDDRAGVAVIYRWRGIAIVGSNPAEAEQNFEAALRIARETGNLPEEENDLNGLAAVANNQGKLHRADEMYEQLLASGRRRDDKWAVQMALNNMGNDLLLEGRLAEAQQMEAEAVAISRESGQKIGIADGLASLGQIHELQGDLAGAQRDFEESAAVYRSIGAESTTAPALAGQAEILRDRDSLNDSWDRHSTALKFFVDAGDAFSMASEQLALARLDLDRGNAADAAALAGKAAESFRNQKSDAQEALSEALLAEALAGQAKPAEARTAAQHAMNHLARSEDTLVRLQAQLAAAQALISLSDQSNGAKASETLRLRAIADEATRRGIVSLALEARAIEAAQARRNLRAARTNAALEREAREKGFLRIANVVQKSSAHL